MLTFLGSAIPDSQGFSYAVVIIDLFETGYVAAVPGVATARPGHLSAPGGAVRFADALRRGLAPAARVALKGADALAAGSLGARDPDAVFGKSS